MTARRFRQLSAAEIELWRAVAESVAPRPGSSLPSLPEQKPAPAPAKPAEAIVDKHPVRSLVAPYRPPQSGPRSAALPLAPLERPYRRRVTRGQIGIERVIDLHGLNQAEAHGALRGFLRAAQADDLRLILIVTGKGRRPAGGSEREPAGVLRRSVPHWLREADLRAIVLGFEEAGQPHGGAGALYVRLRQRRDP